MNQLQQRGEKPSKKNKKVFWQPFVYFRPRNIQRGNKKEPPIPHHEENRRRTNDGPHFPPEKHERKKNPLVFRLLFLFITLVLDVWAASSSSSSSSLPNFSVCLPCPLPLCMFTLERVPSRPLDHSSYVETLKTQS